MSAMNFFFGSLRLLEGEGIGDAGVGVEFGAELLAALEIAFRKFDGRKLLGLNLFGQFSNGGVKDGFFEHARAQDFLGAAAVCGFLSRSTRGFK